MAGKVEFTDADLKAGYLIARPGWIPVRVKGCNQKLSKKEDSTNSFLVVTGLDNEVDPEMKDVEVVKLYNSKLMKLAMPFFRAAQGVQKVTTKDADFDDYKDVILEAYIERGKDQDGNPMNDIKDWRPLQTAK